MRISALDALAPRRTVFGQGDPMLKLVNDAVVSDEAAGVELNVNLVLGLAHFDSAANPGDRNRVAVGVKGDVALDIYHALVQPVDLRYPEPQPLPMKLLAGEHLAAHRSRVFPLVPFHP